MTDEAKKIRNWDLILFIAHGLLFVITLIVSMQDCCKDAYIYGVKTFRMIDRTPTDQTQFLNHFVGLSTVAAVNTTFSGSNLYNTMVAIGTDVKSFNNDKVCYSRAKTQQISWGSSDTYYSTVDNRRMDKVSKWWLLYIITLVTSVAHFLRYWRYSHVHALINKNAPRWDRWVEYAISSPLMIILIAYASGTVESPTLLLLFASQIMLVITGLAIEVVSYEGSVESNEVETAIPGNYVPAVPEMPGPEYWQGVANKYQPMQPISIKTPFDRDAVAMGQASAMRPQLQAWSDYGIKSGMQKAKDLGYKKYHWYSLIFNFFSWFVFLMIWAVIIWNLNDMLTVFDCVNDKNLTRRTAIPLLIVIFEFILFFSFGAISIYYSLDIQHYRSKGEMSNLAYNILSAVSKIILVILLLVEASTFTQNPN